MSRSGGVWKWSASCRTKSSAAGEAIYRRERLVATYFHGYFPSNPRAAAQLFKP